MFISADYTRPIEPLRHELHRLLTQNPHWNGNTRTVLVTDAGDTTVQNHFLMSARDSNSLWNLRRTIREGMIAFIQNEFPERLPRVRARMVGKPEQ